MMGRSHALSGIAVGLTGATAYGLPPGSAIFAAAVCGGAAVLPDIDHPDASISRTFGHATRALAWVVCRASGGHRNGTHSAFGCALATIAVFGATALHLQRPGIALAGLAVAAVLLATGVAVRLKVGVNRQTCYKTPWGGAVAALFIAALAGGAVAAATAHGRIVGTVLLGLLLLLVLAALARAMRIPGKWDERAVVGIAVVAVAPELVRQGVPGYGGLDLTLVPWAVAVGVVVHAAGDAITKGGVPWGWPLTQVNVGPRWFVTDGQEERRIVLPVLTVVTAAAMGWLAGWPVGVACGAALAWLLVKTSRPQRKRSRKTPLRSR